MGYDMTDPDKDKTRQAEVSERDWLTGVFNRDITEKKVNESIEQNQTGTMLLIDIDNFERINDRYGHIMGDRLLQKITQVLGSMVFKRDILGRVGGDQFIIFMPVEQTLEFIEERVRQIKDRLKEVQMRDLVISKLSVRAGGSLYRAGDDYRSLLERASSEISLKKCRGKAMESTKQTPVMKKGIAIDMKLIRAEMSEQQLIPGAYCQDYDMFKSIYRFVERRLRRTKGSAFIILFTLSDGYGEFPELDEREDKMDVLKDLIQKSLRLGDVFTQYSSCQFLIMVSDVEAKDADRIAARIKQEFYSAIMEEEERETLLHHCYPMKPAGE